MSSFRSPGFAKRARCLVMTISAFLSIWSNWVVMLAFAIFLLLASAFVAYFVSRFSFSRPLVSFSASPGVVADIDLDSSTEPVD